MKVDQQEAAAEADPGPKRFDEHGFVRARLGNRELLLGNLEDGRGWKGHSEQIGTVRIEGRVVMVETPFQNARITLANSSEIRELRSRIQSLQNETMPIARISRSKGASNEDREVTIEFIFASEQRHLSGKICFQVNPEIASQANWKGEVDKFPKALVGSLVLRLKNGVVMFVKPRAFFCDDAEDDSDIVEFLNASGDTVICRAERQNAGAVLVVKQYCPRPTDRPDKRWTERRLRIFGLDETPDLLEQSEPGSLVVLETLTEKRSPFLSTWKKYRKLAREANEDLHKNRLSTDLSFDKGSTLPDDPKVNRIHIANWSDAKEKWEEVNAIPVFVAPQAADLAEREKRRNAILLSVDGDGDARLEWKETTPINKGVIRVGDRSNANDTRVEGAMKRLEDGQSVMSNLREQLNDPSNTLAPKSITLKSQKARKYDLSQQEAIEKALGNRSIVAIQGPPGTGKTRVIVATVLEFLRRHKDRGPDGFKGKFRVLISSAQNVAVFNAVDVLEAEGVLINQRLSNSASSDIGNRLRVEQMESEGREILKKLEVRLDSEPELRFQAEQTKVVREMVRELRGIQVDGLWIGELKELLEKWLSQEPKPSVHILEAIETYLKEIVALPKGSSSLLSSMDSVDQIRQILLETEAQKSAREALVHLRKYENEFDSSGLSQEYERLCDALKVKARSGMGLANYELDSTAIVRGMIEDLSRKCPKVIEEERSDLLLISEEIQKKYERLKAELEGYSNCLRQEKGGVLDEWRTALKEEPGLWKNLKEKYSLITGSTCQMSAPPRKWSSLQEAYDLVILDEAARIDPGELMIPLTLGKKILLVGDQKQLPPFIDSFAARRLLFDDPEYLRLLNEQSFFEELFEALPEQNKVMLNRQYRSHTAIGNAISGAFYGGRLKSGPEDSLKKAKWTAERTPFWDLYGNRPICWLDTDDLGCDKATSLNRRESEVAVGVVQIALKAMKDEKTQIGIIGFYQDQVKHLQSQLETSITNYNRYLELGTVDSFQGKEFPIVILLTTRFDPKHGKVGFLALPNRVNVAVSRAQRQLIIIGSRKTLLHQDGGSQPFKDFLRAAGSDVHYIKP